MKHVPQLDSLRGGAILLVIFSHWLPGGNSALNIFLGNAGVNIFFVLSGFLITQILFNLRKDNVQESTGSIRSIRVFYIRRAIRIFPIYYLTLLILWIIGPSSGTNIRGDIFFYLTYTANILTCVTQRWNDIISHFWSLSVEEQFYLFWPWLILFIPKKHLLSIILISVILGFISNFIFSAILPDNYIYDILTPTCFDAFGLGSLISFFIFYKDVDQKKAYSQLKFLSIACLLLLLIFLVFNIPFYIPQRTLMSVCFSFIIFYIIIYPNNLVNKLFLNSKALIYIGKISYGIYIYHKLLPSLTQYIVKQIGPNRMFTNSFYMEEYGQIIITGFNFLFLLVISSLSWYLVEKPINNLKKEFQYI